MFETFENVFILVSKDIIKNYKINVLFESIYFVKFRMLSIFFIQDRGSSIFIILILNSNKIVITS
jgi:hypothetical protein